MTGFQSRSRDAINQAAPTFATASVSQRGLSYFCDPSTTGDTRFMQKSGFPFALLTPQMSAALSETAAAGTKTVRLNGARLLDWLMPGMGVAFELLEDNIVDSFTDLGDGIVEVVLRTSLTSTHEAGTRFTIRSFPVNASTGTIAGDGAIGAPAVAINSPFIMVPGDVLVIDGKTYTLASAEEVGVGPTYTTFEVKLNDDDGFPELTTATDIIVLAKAAYRSQTLTVPQAQIRSLTTGPVAVDWVSGPMVADYFPSPESEVYIEEFDAANRQIVQPRKVSKNDTLLRFQIQRDQMLFWRAAEGRVDWDGTFMHLKALDQGRAHLWTPCRPALDAAPPITTSAVVPGFAPYRVLLFSRIVDGSVRVQNATTRAEIPSTDYTINSAAGTIDFLAAYANAPVLITYRPRLEWQLSAIADVDDVEVCVKVGNEDKQVFTLATAGVSQILTIEANEDEPVDQLHITIRRADDSAGAFTVKFGDWQPRGGITSAIRYTLTTGAEIDYDWASSGLIFKPLWPTIELLRARLDGDSILSRYLDNGRMLV